MPATGDPSLRSKQWNPPPQLTGGFSGEAASTPYALDDYAAHPDAYMGYPDIMDEIAKSVSWGPVQAAEDRLRPFVQSLRSYSPLYRSEELSAEYGCEILIKDERHLAINAFKLRGVLNKVLQLSASEREKGFVAMSTGNHAQAVAYAAKLVGTHATIFMPTKVPLEKISATEEHGAKVILKGHNLAETTEHCNEYWAKHDELFIHPYDDVDVITGQATSAYEALTERPDTTKVLVPVGGGGLVAGSSMAAKELGSPATIYGVEPHGSNAFAKSMQAGRLVSIEKVDTIAEGAAVTQPGELGLRKALQNGNVQVLTVYESEMTRETVRLNELLGDLEFTSALGFVGLKHLDLASNDIVVVVATGQRVDQKLLKYWKTIHTEPVRTISVPTCLPLVSKQEPAFNTGKSQVSA